MNEWPHSHVKHTVASRHSFSNITAWKMSERNFLKLQLKSNLLQSPDQVPHYIKQPSYFHYFISFLGPISTLKFNIIDFNAHCRDQKLLALYGWIHIRCKERLSWEFYPSWVYLVRPEGNVRVYVKLIGQGMDRMSTVCVTLHGNGVGNVLALGQVWYFVERYRKSTSIRHFEQCNQQFSNWICHNCDGSIKNCWM